MHRQGLRDFHQPLTKSFLPQVSSLVQCTCHHHRHPCPRLQSSEGRPPVPSALGHLPLSSRAWTPWVERDQPFSGAPAPRDENHQVQDPRLPPLVPRPACAPQLFFWELPPHAKAPGQPRPLLAPQPRVLLPSPSSWSPLSPLLQPPLLSAFCPPPASFFPPFAASPHAWPLPRLSWTGHLRPSQPCHPSQPSQPSRPSRPFRPFRPSPSSLSSPFFPWARPQRPWPVALQPSPRSC
mmetsp:Transcript_15675/g.35653  ORF Transcript_15675/g.35653 Transcript_15675/m.35653 type:complete len:237 (-) Transcript_15675:249-959(-)